MSNPELSLQLFNQGLEAERQVGKHPERDPQMSKNLDAVIAYEGATVQNGMEVVVEGLQELTNHEQEYRKRTADLMNALVSLPFEKMK